MHWCAAHSLHHALHMQENISTREAEVPSCIAGNAPSYCTWVNTSPGPASQLPNCSCKKSTACAKGSLQHKALFCSLQGLHPQNKHTPALHPPPSTNTASPLLHPSGLLTAHATDLHARQHLSSSCKPNLMS
jgi:hypothetical protein